ncbi:MAG: tRNA dihydrouridine synthase DusB [Bowdeniella nasicola]|nr:tRNA dihydrouridine synthase DusB [Bowdeniella nasicola]
MAPRTLTLGSVTLPTPVILAPMAGVTTPPFRQLCREAGQAGLPKTLREQATVPLQARAGLYVTEMVTSRALVERHPATMAMIATTPDDPVRSVQLYGVDPITVGEAVRILVAEDRADHIDLNFGCPVPKVTRRGGGAALPWKIELYRAIITRAVRTAEREAPAGKKIPITVKMRLGIDTAHRTDRDAALVARDAGIAAVALHARTAAQHYSGHAHWDEIAKLKALVGEYPIFGNGDIFSADDALNMMRQTGCDGVVIGRGCQGRPWLFTDVVAAMYGTRVHTEPSLADVAAMVYRHGELMVAHLQDEGKALREMRKHMAWYFRGYRLGGAQRHRLALVTSLADLHAKLSELDLSQPYPGSAAEGPRGRAGGEKIPHLPEGWLNSRELAADHRAQLHEAELGISGG